MNAFHVSSPGNAVASLPTNTRYVDANCWTAPYVAGANERALINASMALSLNQVGFIDFIAMSSANGFAPVGLGNGFVWQGASTFPSATVFGIVDLVQGTSYEFGIGVRAYISGTTTSSHPCQTLVQIVKR